MVIDSFHDSSDTILEIIAIAPAVYCSNTVWFWKHSPYCKKTKQEKKFSGLVTCTYKQTNNLVYIYLNIKELEGTRMSSSDLTFTNQRDREYQGVNKKRLHKGRSIQLQQFMN
jgi:hypothetical protein